MGAGEHSSSRGSLTHGERLRTLFEQKRLVRARDVQRSGIPHVYLTRLVKAGEARRVGHGLYELAGAPWDERDTYAQVCARIDKAVIGLLSAAQLHELTVIAPPTVWIFLPPGTPRPRVDFVRLEVAYMDPALLDHTAVEALDYFGASIRVTTPAKTVVDLFRYRNRVGLDAALEALRTFIQTQPHIHDLMHHARRSRVDSLITPYLQAMLA